MLQEIIFNGMMLLFCFMVLSFLVRTVCRAMLGPILGGLVSMVFSFGVVALLLTSLNIGSLLDFKHIGSITGPSVQGIENEILGSFNGVVNNIFDSFKIEGGN